MELKSFILGSSQEFKSINCYVKSFQSVAMSQQPIDTNCMTLTRFVLAEQRRFGGSGDLSQLLTSIQSAVKAISAAVRRAGISKLFGAAGDTNVQGEEVREILNIFLLPQR